MPRKTKKVADIFTEETNKKIYGQYKPSIHHYDRKSIFSEEQFDTERVKYILSPQYQADRLEHLKSIVPLDALDRANDTPGRIDKYTSVSHHVWVTDMNNNPRDIVTYRSTVQKENKYTNDKKKTVIDDPYNSFVQSIKNLDEGSIKANVPLSEGKWHHVIWTNFSRDDLIQHPELSSLRKICNIEPVSDAMKAKGFPQFTVININDVMDKKVDDVPNIANSSTALPQVIKDGLLEMKTDLLSVRDSLEDFKSKKMMASISDVVRVAAVKDIGGMYFDLDTIIFDQEKVHTEQQKYNLFDIIKNYRCVVGKETGNSLHYDLLDGYLCNSFISSSQPQTFPAIKTWEILQRNLNAETAPYYIKYSKENSCKILCQTGPASLTVGCLQSLNDESDIAVNYGCLMYISGGKPHTPQTNGDVGALGYDVWGGTWVNNPIPCIAYDENDQPVY